MARIVVTGGSGFIGQHLVKELRKKHDVWIADHQVVPYVDVACYNILKAYLEKIKPDVVFDLATLPLNRSILQPFLVTYKIWCIGSNLCELTREGIIKELVHVSSSEVYQINTPYSAVKDAQDKLLTSYVNTYKIKAYIARPFNAYGPGQTLDAIIPATIKRILLGKRPIINGDGEQQRDFTYVSDIVKGIIEVWKNKQSQDLTSGECYSVAEVVYRISDLLGYKGKPEYLPRRSADTRTIHKERTIKDYVKFNEGLKRTINWWKNSTALTTQD